MKWLLDKLIGFLSRTYCRFYGHDIQSVEYGEVQCKRCGLK